MTNDGKLLNVELDARMEIAKKVGSIVSSSQDGSEHESAIELAKVLAEDVAISVREALSHELRHCHYLPSDLVRLVSKDIEQVSTPFLIACEAIEDSFLEEIVRNCGSSHQKAIAQRDGLSEAVCFAISDAGSLDAVAVLADNETANVSGRGFNRMVDRFPQEISLMEKLATRADLPIEIVERLILKVSRKFGEILTQKFSLSVDFATYLVSLANRQVFSRTLEVAPLSEIEKYLTELHKAGGLEANVLLIYLQNKNLRLFTMSLAILLQQDFWVIEELVLKRDKKILVRLLDSAGFSKSVIGVLLISFERLPT
jgi:uncharacterized protein (DUF2336 family)